LSYVRLSSLAHTDPEGAVRIGRIVLTAVLGGGTLIAIAVFFGAEWIVRQIFQGDYPIVVGLIMLLGLSVPINAVYELFGMQCLIAFGRERSYAAVVAIGAVIFCVLLFTLKGGLAYGWALLAAEACVAAMAGLRLRAVLRSEKGSTRMNDAATFAPVADRQQLPWWTSPAGLTIGFLLPVLFLIAYVGEANISTVTIRGTRFPHVGLHRVGRSLPSW
jgi:hypothetical protein